MMSLFPTPCPQLPEFQSMLVRGRYHASAPVHLLLSHCAQNPEATAICLTPERNALRNALIDLKDRWIEMHSGNGRTSAAALRTEIFYPPTLAHLQLALSMLHEYEDTIHHRKTTLAVAPTLLVLHEISAYFTAQANQATVSAYLSVISSAMALTTSWSSKSASRLVLFDSGLNQLKLPILPSLSFEDMGYGESRRGTLSVLLERYFEWKAEFPEVDLGSQWGNTQDEESPEQETSEIKAVRLSRLKGGRAGHDPEVIWRWRESVQVGEDGQRWTRFLWEHI